MDSYIEPNDDLSKLLMSIGSISKGFGGQGQRMGETASFNISFRPNADPEIKDYFLKIYGDHPEKINFFLPCGDISKCITAPYTCFNSGKMLIAESDGKYFTYIANPDNHLNAGEPYLRDGHRCSDGQRIPHTQDLGFIGKPNMKMQMSGRMYVFIKELLEAGVFQTMALKFHTTADRDMLRKRLSYIRDFAAGIDVPLTAIPMFLTKFKKTTCFIDQGGVPRRTEHFYLDLGLVHFIGTDERHPFSAAFSSRTAFRKDTDLNEEDQSVEVSEEREPEACEETEHLEEEKSNPEDKPESGPAEDSVQEKDWKSSVFPLTDRQQVFVKENISACGSKYGIKLEFLNNYRDRNGVSVTDLTMDELLSQLKTADEYLLRIMKKEITVDKQTETRAKMHRWAFITAALINNNKLTDHPA